MWPRASGSIAKSMLTGERSADTARTRRCGTSRRAPISSSKSIPQQKERIVRALQRTGHAVGYLGDGINDAPALHAADVGISVDQAVDVARESADIVLLKRDLDVLRARGRGRPPHLRQHAEIHLHHHQRQFRQHGQHGAGDAVAALPAARWPSKSCSTTSSPTSPSIAISTDNVDPEQPERRQRWDIARCSASCSCSGSQHRLRPHHLRRPVAVLQADESTFQTTWFVVSLLTELAVLLVLRTRGPLRGSRPSRLLILATLAMALLAVALPYAGPLSRIFGLCRCRCAIVIAAILIVAAYVTTTEALKLYF